MFLPLLGERAGVRGTDASTRQQWGPLRSFGEASEDEAHDEQ